MSIFFRVTRTRWAAREMVLNRWHKTALQRAAPREPICELGVDGERVTVSAPSDDSWGLYTQFVPEGEEVGPGGELFEYSDSGLVPTAESLKARGFVFRRFQYRKRERYPSVFLSYRREDSEPYAWRLHEALGHRFGAENVFMDQFSILPGEPFTWAVQQSAAHCEVLIALLGPKWLTVADARGRRRLDSQTDLVRREITAALDRRISVIPILLADAVVPDVESLPDELHGFEQLQMLQLSARHWTTDLGTLLASVDGVLAGRNPR